MSIKYNKNKITLIDDSSKEIGYIAYTITGDKVFNLEHTVVYPEYQGKGLAKILLLEAISFCKNHGYKINPICSYAAAFFKKNKEYYDLLKQTN